MSETDWNSYKLGNNETLLWNKGLLNLQVNRSHNDWTLKSKIYSEEGDVENVLNELDGQRWAFSDSTDTVRISPCMPDRSLVVRPIKALNIPPSSKIQFFIDIPVWIKIEIGAKKQFAEVARIESQKLSNTWFGDTTAGLFCYANKSFIRREIDTGEVEETSVLCPFNIVNNGREPLPVDRICVHVKHLSIFKTASGLWSNDVTATFRGHGKSTTVEHSRNQPPLAGKPEVIYPAEEKPEKHFAVHTFLHTGIFKKTEKETK